MNINGLVASVRGASVWVAVEALKVLRRFRVGRNPVRIRMDSDGSKKWTARQETLLQKPLFLTAVLLICLDQILTSGEEN